MKGEKTLQLLENIGDAVIDSTDLLRAFLDSGYGASLGRIQNKAEQLGAQRRKRNSQTDDERRGRQRFYEMLHYLEKNGIIERTKKDNKKQVKLTFIGKRKLKSLSDNKMNILPVAAYNGVTNNKTVIVIFDVPEKERRKRDWLRSVLNNLGLKLLQKSVWVGKVKFPQEFLEDLRNLNLIQYVEILEVSKTGDLRQIK